MKKLRRKQSNRESARRSRLRKQAECEALSGKVAHLEQENGQLKDANRALMAQLQELQRMVSQTEQVGIVHLLGSCTPPAMTQRSMSGTLHSC